MEVFGLDIGGSGIKGAAVNTRTGELLAERIRIKTPQPSTPEALVRTAVEVIRTYGWEGPVGCGFPAAIKDGVAQTAANIDRRAIGFDLRGALEEELGSPAVIINDADAAGMAEMRWGAGQGVGGVVLMVTLGTGIGTALFNEGSLVANTELGHIEIDGQEAEARASDGARKREDLGWGEYASRLNKYLTTVENLLWPDLIIVGGGISKKSEKFLPRLQTRTRLVPAKTLNQAGILGAALAGAVYLPKSSVREP